MDMQKLVDAMSDMAAKDRAKYHLTLGKLMERLKGVPKKTPVVFDVGGSPRDPHSYRGYYSDLAFTPAFEKTTAGDLLQACKSSLGEVFEGYKGGDFEMGENTPLWCANYGDTGRAIMDFKRGSDSVILITKEIE